MARGTDKTVTEFTVVIVDPGHDVVNAESNRIRAKKIQQILESQVFPDTKISVWDTGFNEITE